MAKEGKSRRAAAAVAVTQSITVDGAQSIEIGADQRVAVGGSRVIAVGKDRQMQVGGSESVAIRVDDVISVGSATPSSRSSGPRPNQQRQTPTSRHQPTCRLGSAA